MFAAEYRGLQEMAQARQIRVPQPLAWGTTAGHSYLILEWIELGRGSTAGWTEMGRQLAHLHRVTCDRGFGWQMDNTIGETPQINTWMDDWTEFFTQQRLGYQFKLAQRRGGRFAQADTLLRAMPQLLAGHRPQPSLVHGDLWSGNAAFSANGEPVILDPAVYYGDREVDLAMSELFGGFSSAFYEGYQEVWPLQPGYGKRKKLYNLYHILNHFNLFGGGYGYQAERTIEQILADL